MRMVFDLKDSIEAQIIKVPPACILQFEGGCIVNGRIVGHNTRINAAQIKIFGDNVSLEGTWNVKEAFPEWFGARGDGVTDDYIALQLTIKSFPIIKLCSKTYLCNSGIKVENNKIIGNWLVSNDYAQIQKILKVISNTRPDIKVLVIDDANYLLSNATFKDALTKG